MANDSFLKASEIIEFFNDTTFYENFTSTPIYWNYPNSTDVYDNFSNSTQVNEIFSNVTQVPDGREICKNISSSYPTTWDMTVITEVVLSSIVCSIGILGNLYAVMIIFKMDLKTFVQNWRKCMVICDLLLLGCDLNQVTVARFAKSFLATQNHYISLYSFVWVLLYPIRKMLETLTLWITVLISVERIIFLNNPGRAVTFCQQKLSGIMYLLITIFAVSINFPRFREYKALQCFDMELNITSYEIVKTTVVSETVTHYRWALNWVYICSNYIVPILALIVTNIWLWRAVHRYNMDTEKKEPKLEMDFVRMVICYTVIACVCKFPKLVEEVYLNYEIGDAEFMTPFSNLMLSFNSAANFFVYTLF